MFNLQTGWSVEALKEGLGAWNLVDARAGSGGAMAAAPDESDGALLAIAAPMQTTGLCDYHFFTGQHRNYCLGACRSVEAKLSPPASPAACHAAGTAPIGWLAWQMTTSVTAAPRGARQTSPLSTTMTTAGLSSRCPQTTLARTPGASPRRMRLRMRTRMIWTTWTCVPQHLQELLTKLAELICPPQG